MAITVSNVRKEFLNLFPGFFDMGCGSTEKEFLIWIKLLSFWEKLNHLGARNMNEIPPETVPHIDVTVVLTEGECASLRAEMTSLRVDMIELKPSSQKFYA